MFPLAFPLEILRNHAREGDLVLDPFSGRGTTNYAARLLGLPSAAVDSSPVAAAISAAKLANTTPERIRRAAERLLAVDQGEEVPAGEFWSRAFHPEVLAKLARLRAGLLADCASPTRQALRAVVMGALHGPLQSEPWYFSNQAPRTYAPKPNYAVRYWRRHRLRAPQVDVLALIGRRAERFYRGQPAAQGRAVLADSREVASITRATQGRRARWIITSPPYYGMRTYVPDQWVRNWFVGGPNRVDYEIAHQLSHRSPDLFVNDLRQVWRNIAALSTRDARLVIRFGGINDRRAHAKTLILESLVESGWRILTIRDARTARSGRRQADSFGEGGRVPQPEYDIWAGRR
jgi:hypothetical protein